MRAVHALPLVETSLSGPRLSIDGKAVTLPVEVASGSYVEVEPDGDCRLYSAIGELREQSQLEGVMPLLNSGENALELTFKGPDDVPPRARVMVMARGERVR